MREARLIADGCGQKWAVALRRNCKKCQVHQASPASLGCKGQEVLNSFTGKSMWNWDAGDIHVRFLLPSGRWLDGLLIFTVAVAGLYGAARLGLTPRDPASGVGVVFAPWVSESSAVTRATTAGARFVRFGGLPFVVVVVPEAPDYIGRIARQAFLVIDPRVLDACLRLVVGKAAP